MASILRSRVSGVSNDEKGNVINKERKLIKENYYLDNQNYIVIVNCEIPAIDILDSDDIKIWSTVAPFIQVANYSVLQPPILNGNYQLHEQVIQNTLTQSQTIDCDNIIVNPLANSIYISIPGTITAEYDNVYRLYNYTFQLSTIPDSNILSFNITILENEYSNPGDATCFNRVFLNYAMNPDEKELEEDEEIGFYGFGESFTYLNLRGRVVPILVSEQGVGRGVEPLTDYFNVNVSEGAGGDWYTTYAPKAAYFTDTNKGFIVDQSSIIIFDLTSANTVTVEAWSSSLYGHILSGKSWFDLITLMTNITGRPPAPLPRWSQLGAVVGLEGGTENVTKIVNKLLARGVPLAGVWLQDWVGMRHSWDGDRLIWNWEVNYDWYPGKILF